MWRAALGTSGTKATASPVKPQFVRCPARFYSRRAMTTKSAMMTRPWFAGLAGVAAVSVTRQAFVSPRAREGDLMPMIFDAAHCTRSDPNEQG